MDLSQYLQNLIAQGQLKTALDEMLKNVSTERQKYLHNDLISLSGSLSHIESERRKSMISNEYYMLEFNKAKEALLHYLSEFKGGGQIFRPDFPTDKMAEIKKFVPMPSRPPKKVYYTEASYQAIEPLVKQGLVLLVTATDVETKFLHEKMQPLDHKEGLTEVKKHNATYFLGKFGNFAVAHVECGTMGAASSMGSITTTINAINDLKPKFVLMLGIAFGVEPEKQNIGDALVSNAIILYEPQRIGQDERVWRGNKPEASNNLRNTFKNTRGWRFTLPNGENAQFELCDILTGEKLIDNLDVRQSLVMDFPTVRGGEMEGAGIYAACQDKEVPWILVKAICDYADGNKKEHKKEKQELAITVVVDLCLHIFNKKHVFEDMGIRPYEEKAQEDANTAAYAPKSKNYIDLLESDQIPELLVRLDQVTIHDRFMYSRLRKEYQAGLNGLVLIDWKDRMKVFLNDL